MLILQWYDTTETRFRGVIDTAKSKLHGVMTHGQCWVGLCGVMDIPESDSIVSLHQGGRFIWQLQSQSNCCHDSLYELLKIVSKPYTELRYVSELYNVQLSIL